MINTEMFLLIALGFVCILCGRAASSIHREQQVPSFENLLLSNSPKDKLLVELLCHVSTTKPYSHMEPHNVYNLFAKSSQTQEKK